MQSEINTNEINYENDVKREKQIEQEIETNISELDSTRIQRSEKSGNFQEIESNRNEIVSQITGISKKKEEANTQIKQFETILQNSSNEMRIKESKLKFLIETEKEKEGYIRSVKALLKDCEQSKELGKGMQGVLANLIEVSEKYETAIEMCLGASLQNIVTNTEEDAKRLVEHLRRNNLGRASFLPISSVRGRKIEKIKGNENGIIGIASDLIKFDKKYEQIILNLLGRTVIVDNMETAIKVAKKYGYSFRIITLEGDLINPSGAITGGSITKKTINILGRGREIERLEKEIKKLKEKILITENEKQQYINSIEKTIQQSGELEKKLQEINITYAIEKQKVSSIEEHIQRLEKRLEKLREEKEHLIKQKEEYKKNKEKIKTKIENIEEETKKLNKIIMQYAELNKDNQKYIDDLNFDITNLKISVSSFDESEISIQEMEERINIDIENSNKSIENKEKEIKNIKEVDKKIENSIKEINKNIEKIRYDVENSGSKVEKLKQSRIEKNEKLEKKEIEITEKINIIENIKGQLIKLEIKKTKMEENITEVINKMWEEYELTPNAVESYKKPENVINTNKRVNELRKNIKELGSINIDSIEEYKNLKERYDFMCEQRLDLESTMAKLRKMILEMTSIMKEQFKEKFKQINKNFVEVFKELFGGGNASLRLEDESNILECGIEITVQPPGKKLQNMMLLSGGEKAFTAIALLFAILKINPAPFCVLDEIEAALDDSNVYRFAEYLKKFAKDTQFLVITHRKGTMEVADTLYGATMEENGISKLLSMKLKRDV